MDEPSPNNANQGQDSHLHGNYGQGSQGRFREEPLEVHRGSIFELSQDQNGCRYLQRMIDIDRANVNTIFDEIESQVVPLMMDNFGNYLCQKLLDWVDNDQRMTLIRNASGSVLEIAMNQHGTRALQKMIQTVSSDEQTNVITDALSQNVIGLIKNINGNHVIQRCLNNLRAPQNDFIYDAVSAQIVECGTHRHGCCVLQRCLDHATPAQKKQLIAAVLCEAFTLMQDQFGIKHTF